MQVIYKIKNEKYSFDELGIETVICDYDDLTIFPTDIILLIFASCDFSGKLYFWLTCKKYNKLTKGDLKHFASSVPKSNKSYRINTNNERAWLRLCMDGHIRLLKKLFFRLKSSCIKYRTFIFSAVRYGLTNIVKLLIEKKYYAKISQSLRDDAIMYDHLEILKLLMEKSNCVSPCQLINKAAESGHVRMIVYIKKLYPEVELTTATFNKAIVSGNLEMVKYLLSSEKE
jgi:hypothetical protein